MHDTTADTRYKEALAAAAFIVEQPVDALAGFIVLALGTSETTFTASNTCCRYHMIKMLATAVAEELADCHVPCCGGCQ